MSYEIDPDRRRFFTAAALALAATQFDLTTDARAQHSTTKAPRKTAMNSNTSFAPRRQINAGLLNVGYAEAGPAEGPVVVLLHGWPYDIHSFVEVTPLLASSGYRVIVPYLRGYGSTRFLSSATLRNGQPSALARDVIDLMDALKIQKATLAGYDWGGRSADIVAALWPERCKALVSVSGYLISLAARARRRRGKIRRTGKRLAASPNITVPTITLEGDANGAPHAEPGSYARKFSGKYAHRTINGGVGHNLPQEAPQAFAEAIRDVEHL